jgi:hypothetical protein
VNVLKNSIDVLHDIVVPVTQNHVVHGFQDFCSLRISVCSSCMLTAVQFDNEMGVSAKEVDDITVDRELPPEFPAIQAPITQTKPQYSFRIR